MTCYFRPKINYRNSRLNFNIIIGSTALAEPRPPQTNVASDLHPGHPPANFYDPVSLRLPVLRQSTNVRRRVETESGGTRRRTGGEVKGKEANGVGSQQSSA